MQAGYTFREKDLNQRYAFKNVIEIFLFDEIILHISIFIFYYHKD